MTYIPAKNICLHAKFQVWWCYGYGSTALQQDLEEEEEEEEEEEDKEHEKTCFVVSWMLCRNKFIVEVFFTLMSLEMEIT